MLCLIFTSLPPIRNPQPLPPLRPELVHHFNIPLKNHRRIRKAFRRAGDAAFADQVQGGVGGAVGVVAHVVRLGVGKLKIRVKAGHLQHAFQAEGFRGGFGQVEQVVEYAEFRKQGGVDQQGGVDFFRVGVGQAFEFAVQFFQKLVGVAGVADHVADLIFDVHRFGEWAEVEADHGFFQPDAGGVDHGLVVGGVDGGHGGLSGKAFGQALQVEFF